MPKGYKLHSARALNSFFGGDSDDPEVIKKWEETLTEKEKNEIMKRVKELKI